LFDFYENSAGWEWEGINLTHAAALVFCHHKTTIDRMTKLARELAEIVKNSPQGRKRDLFEYLALESVDYPVEPISHFWHTTYGAMEQRRRPLRPVSGASDLLRRLADHRESANLPRGKWLQALRALVRADPDQSDSLEQPGREFMQLLKTIRDSGDEANEEMDQLEAALEQMFPGQDDFWRWLHFNELWDYLAPREKEKW
jgi:hypothetical protein